MCHHFMRGQMRRGGLLRNYGEVCGTNEVVDVVLPHLVQADLQQHGDGSETRQ